MLVLKVTVSLLVDLGLECTVLVPSWLHMSVISPALKSFNTNTCCRFIRQIDFVRIKYTGAPLLSSAALTGWCDSKFKKFRNWCRKYSCKIGLYDNYSCRPSVPYHTLGLRPVREGYSLVLSDAIGCEIGHLTDMFSAPNWACMHDAYLIGSLHLSLIHCA